MQICLNNVGRELKKYSFQKGKEKNKKMEE